jgi:D-alanyl-D-alanine carboxypeptidase (penicillin-binding protein 5/6)
MRLRFDQFVSLLVVLAGLGLAIVAQTKTTQPATAIVVPTDWKLAGVNPVPVFQPAGQLAPATASAVAVAMSQFTATLSAEAIYVMDVPSAAILLSKNPEDSRYPASTTKLLTALVALDVYSPNQVLTVGNENQTEGTTIGLQTGENVTVRDLLAGLLIQSGNDAAMVLANNHPQSYAGFIAAMNYKATELGLTHSTFTNPAGLDEWGHTATARDLAIISREVMKSQVLLPIVRTKKMQISDTTFSITHTLTNTNELLDVEAGVVGVKTGTTDLAGEVLITQYQHQGREMLVVLMGSQNRYFETKQIYNWIFNSYQWQTFDSGTLN